MAEDGEKHSSVASGHCPSSHARASECRADEEMRMPSRGICQYKELWSISLKLFAFFFVPLETADEDLLHEEKVNKRSRSEVRRAGGWESFHGESVRGDR